MTRWLEPSPPQGNNPFPDLHPLIGQTLLNRGYRDPATAESFLHPDFYQPAPATDLPGLSAAADRIQHGIRTGEEICVWGDFDVDGQTSTTVLVQTLKAVGAKVRYHIPIRQNESHGVNLTNLAKVIDEGASLVVTCDTGISAAQEVEYARSRGVEMVITDHHDLPEELPKATAVVDPKMLPGDHPLATLAGVGVAYKLAEELIQRMQPANLQAENLLDLAALGLVADLALLRGDARYLVQKGLAQLRRAERLGLKTIMELAEVSAAHLTEEHIGFAIGPRLNALGRLGDANPIVELFTTDDSSRVRVLAVQLESLNAQRKLLCDQVYQAAEAQLREKPELLAQPIIILAHPQWPGGVVGIVASRIVERYQKPAILLTAPSGQPMRGSARSIEGLNITAAIAAQKDILLGFGGHPMAAGLALDPEKLTEFRRKMSATVNAMLGKDVDREGSLQIDGWLEVGNANLELAEMLESLAPFGPGNPKLTLATHNLRLISSAKLGKNKEHLKLTMADENGNKTQVIWWDGGMEEGLPARFDLAYSLRASDWHGSRQAQLELVDFRALEVEEITIPTKKLEVVDYRNLKNPEKALADERVEGETICWAEGEEKKRTQGMDRTELAPARKLILWTVPASRQELLAVMEKVQPEKIVVFGIDPGFGEPQPMLDRLAGLVNFVLNKKNGQSNLAQLAAALAQGEGSARLGLEWMNAKGLVTVTFEKGNEVKLSAGGSPDFSKVDNLFEKLAQSLAESKFYRKHFREQKEINLA